jgi:hypothetical protein
LLRTGAAAISTVREWMALLDRCGIMSAMRTVPGLVILHAVGATVLAATAATAAAAPVERRLHSDAAEASSFLWNDWNRFQENYHPNYVADDDPRTAWVEGAASSGAGEWVRIKVTKLDGVSAVRLRLRNGYQKSKALFAANARIKDVTIKLLPSGKTTRAMLPDAMEWQELTVKQDAGPLEGVEIQVGSVYEGSKYADLCLSDAQIFATATDRQNPVFEKLKLTALQAWKKDRVAAAKQFRAQGAKTMPLLTAYTEVAGPEDTAEGVWDKCQNDVLCHTREALARAGRARELQPWTTSIAIANKALAGDPGLFAAKVAPTDARSLPPLDGFRTPEAYDGIEIGAYWKQTSLPIYGVVGALRTDTLRVIETRSPVSLADAVAAKPAGCQRGKGATFTWALRQKGEAADAGRDLVRAVVAVHCAYVETRDGGSESAVPQVLVYDPQGRLALVAGPGYVDGFTWATVDGRDAIVSARGIGESGWHGVDRRMVAAAP